MFVTKEYRVGVGPEQRYTILGHYHLNCYLLQANYYLDNNPMVASNPNGRPHIQGLTEEQRKQRQAILVKRSSLEQRKRKLKTPYPERWQYEVEINKQIAELAIELIVLGGVPEGWNNSLVLSKEPT
jgi:hypothetical protein